MELVRNESISQENWVDFIFTKARIITKQLVSEGNRLSMYVWWKHARMGEGETTEYNTIRIEKDWF
jgi:hypothetical protein